MNFSTLQGLTIPEGVVTQIAKDGVVLWALKSGKIELEVEKFTSDTKAGETTYTGEQFILLDIYTKTNGTVKVTYGGLTKTITDTSGADSPNAQRVFFGTFNGVSDSVATPTSGTLTIEGDCVAFGCSTFDTGAKIMGNKLCACVTEIKSFGEIEYLPSYAFGSLATGACEKITSVTMPQSVKSIGNYAFTYCSLLETVVFENGLESIGDMAFMGTNITSVTMPQSVKSIGNIAFQSTPILVVEMLGTTPPTLVGSGDSETGEIVYKTFGSPTADGGTLQQIIVPKGCSNVYKTATGWSTYANYIVEAS